MKNETILKNLYSKRDKIEARICEIESSESEKIEIGDTINFGKDTDGKDIVKKVFAIYKNVIFLEYCGISLISRNDFLRFRKANQ